MIFLFNLKQISPNHGVPPPMRAHRASNAVPMNIKDVFDVDGGPNSQIYGTRDSPGQINQAYEHVVDDADRNSLRLAPRNLQGWSGGGPNSGNSSAKL